MKPKNKIIFTIGILLALSSIISNSPIFSVRYSDDSNFDTKNLQNSALSGRIHIDNNWTAAKSAGIVTGDGIYSDPYVIEDLVIDAGDLGSGILIENSDVYFKVVNCTVYNSGIRVSDAGIKFYEVAYGKLINNNASNNQNGIYLDYSNNNTISGNIANNNSFGIYLYESNDNLISGNTVNNNYHDGISLWWFSDNNHVSGNTANNNTCGIRLSESHYNIVSGNILIRNDECIIEVESTGNTFNDNGPCTNGQRDGENKPLIPGFNLYFLLGVMSVTIILIRKKLRKA